MLKMDKPNSDKFFLNLTKDLSKELDCLTLKINVADDELSVLQDYYKILKNRKEEWELMYNDMNKRKSRNHLILEEKYEMIQDIKKEINKLQLEYKGKISTNEKNSNATFWP